MLVQYLVTVMKKEKGELKKFLDSLNVKGSILVGNQRVDNNDVFSVEGNGYTATVFNSSEKGVSRNRNMLLEKAVADYVTFLDDDMRFKGDAQITVEQFLAKNKYTCVRFNVVSNNQKREIKLINKNGFVGFHKLTSYGVFGCFFRTAFLREKSLKFNESVGPGTNINHGEDGVFLHDFLRKGKIYSKKDVVFEIDQFESTWINENRDYDLELFSHGYIYYLLYKKMANIMSILFLITHMWCYPKGSKYSILRKNMKKGIATAKKELR